MNHNTKLNFKTDDSLKFKILRVLMRSAYVDILISNSSKQGSIVIMVFEFLKIKRFLIEL